MHGWGKTERLKAPGARERCTLRGVLRLVVCCSDGGVGPGDEVCDNTGVCEGGDVPQTIRLRGMVHGGGGGGFITKWEEVVLWVDVAHVCSRYMGEGMGVCVHNTEHRSGSTTRAVL
jgi:hypothetical protein